MNRSFFYAVGIAACAAAPPGFAEPPFSLSLTPALAFGVQFGGVTQLSESPLHFTAQFGVRSPLPRAADVPLLSVFQFGADRRGRLDLVRVLGRDMLTTSDRLNETGESGVAGSNNWIWWTGGVLATGAVVAVAASGGGGGDNNSGGRSSAGRDCVGTNTNLGPGPTDVDPGEVDTSGCAVDGDIGGEPFRVP